MNKCEITLKASQWASVRIREDNAVWTTDSFQAVDKCFLRSDQEIMIELAGGNQDLDNIENMVLMAHFETKAESVNLMFQCTEKAEAVVNGVTLENFSEVGSVEYILTF